MNISKTIINSLNESDSSYNYVVKVKDKDTGKTGYLSGDEDTYKFWIEDDKNLANHFTKNEESAAKSRCEANNLIYLGLESLDENLVEMPYSVYQTDDRDIAFMRYDYVSDKFPEAFNNYKKVYDGVVLLKNNEDVDYALEDIFIQLNRDDRPNSQEMRSLSVSDIIYINNKYYYVDYVGFQELEIN